MSQLTYVGALHLAAGIGVSLAGSVALVARKGAATHIWAGRAFTSGMAMVCATGLWMSISRQIVFTLLLSIFAAHLVATGWAAVRQDSPVARRVDEISAIASLTLSLACAATAAYVAMHPSGQMDGLPYPAFLALGGVSLLLWHGDLGCREPLSRKRRFLRHGGRLATAQLISLLIFAFGNSQILPAVWRAPSILLTPIGIYLVFFALQMAAIVMGRHQVFYIAHSKAAH